MREDMIHGNPAKSLIAFAIPMILGNLFQQIYNMVDSMVVGRFVGEEALSAVGISYSITMVVICVATGTGIGSAVIISQLLGAGRLREMKTAIFTALIAILGFSIIICAAGLLFHRQILTLMNTPANIFEDTATYLGIYFGGVIFLFMYNILASIYNALGDSRTPLCFLIFSSILNVALDLWLVIQFNMGVAGVAWATLIAQGLSAILSFIVLLRKISKIEHQGDYQLFDKDLLKKMFKVALPSMVQQSIVSVGMLLVQIVINGFGSSVIAGFAAAMKIDSIAIMPMMAVGNAMSTFTAQNIGAGREERVKEGYKVSILLIAAIGVIIFALIQLFGKTFMGAFLDTSSGSIAYEVGMKYLNVISFFYILLGLFGVANGILRGAGDLLTFMLSSLINLTFRVSFAFILGGVLGPKAIWWSVPVGWAIGCLISVGRYLQGGWKNKTLIQ